MKKFLFMGALAAMLLGTASCSNDMEPAMGDNTVQFTIELPGAIDSRAIADGTTAKKLTVAVYDKDGNHLNLDKTVEMTYKRATVTFQLVKGQEYSFAFWAQAPDATCYTFNTDDATMTVNNYTSECNDEKRDAFYWYEPNFEITGTMTKNITLYRPFAQLNFGASDAAAAAKAGVVAKKSYVEVKQVSTKFDLKSGHASKTDLVDAKFALAALPSDPAKLTVEGTQYDWMAMNYFLVPGDDESDKATIETTLKLYTENDEANAVREITVSNVPVEKNHRTNIVGNLFTEDVNFNIIIDERFDQPDYNYLTDPDKIAAAIAVPNAEVYLGIGTNVPLDLSQIAEGVTIHGNGSKLDISGKNTISSENVIIEDVELINNTNNNDKFIEVKSSNLTLRNVTFNGSASQEYGLWTGGTSDEGNVLIENCTIAIPRVFRCVYLNNKGTVTIKESTLGESTYGHYALNTGTTSAKLIVEDTEIIGWISFNGVQEPTFTNCTFKIGRSGYGYLCPYVNTQMTGCKFEWKGENESNPQQHYLYGPRNACTTTFTNCTWTNGSSLDSNLLATDKDSNYKDCIAIIGNQTWKNLDGNANGNSWTLQE